MINRNNLDIHALLNKDTESRFKGIYVNNKETMATTGASLIVVEKPHIDKDELPSLPSGETDNNEATYIITKDVAKETIRNIPKKSRFSILENVIEHAVDGTVELITTDLQTIKKTQVRQDHESAPRYEELLDDTAKKEPVKTLWVDANRLGKICDIIAKITPHGYMKLHIYQNSDCCASKITAENHETNQKIVALIMPLRIDNFED